MNPDYLRSKFEAALSYEAYLRTGDDDQRQRWGAVYEQATLTEAQKQLVGSFARDMKLLAVSGIWCGDCVQQLPLVQRIVEASSSGPNGPRLDYRLLDRDEHTDLSEQLKICGGMRVPVVALLDEEYNRCAIIGDRTLSRYRALATRQLGTGAVCELGVQPSADTEMADTLQDWLDEIERVQLMLRISPRLRQKHGD